VKYRSCLRVLILLNFCSPSLAMAHWAYTQWGMTPEQVVAASAGTAKLLPAAGRTRNEDDHWELSVEGTYRDGPLNLSVGFMFDTQSGGLKCVMYNATGADVTLLRDTLIGRYGKPVNESGFLSSRTATWRTPDNIEFTAALRPVAAVVSHCVLGTN
jgi:hypothetical protein